jgi:hypothetical protein
MIASRSDVPTTVAIGRVVRQRCQAAVTRQMSAAGKALGQLSDLGSTAFPEQVAIVVRDALAMQDSLNAALDAGAELDQGHAILRAVA